MRTWSHLDEQMQWFEPELVQKVKVSHEQACRLATTIASEVRFLGAPEKTALREATPIPFQQRLEELVAFQEFMEQMRSPALAKLPAFVRAQVIVQNYVSFVYLPEAYFGWFAKNMPAGTATKKCAKFLSNNPVRALRNAVAHANWRYTADFSGIEFWARKGSDPDEALTRFEVGNAELGFWQSLARCVAYAGLSNL